MAEGRKRQGTVQKTDVELEAEAIKWIEEITEAEFDEEDDENISKWLETGVTLCKLINTIKPDSVKEVHRSKTKMMQIQNVEAFLKAARAIGVPPQDLFSTNDLITGQNRRQVVQCIHSLGRVAQKLGFDGPKLGIRLATENKREFTDEQMRRGSTMVPKLMNSGKLAVKGLREQGRALVKNVAQVEYRTEEERVAAASAPNKLMASGAANAQKVGEQGRALVKNVAQVEYRTEEERLAAASAPNKLMASGPANAQKVGEQGRAVVKNVGKVEYRTEEERLAAASVPSNLLGTAANFESQKGSAAFGTKLINRSGVKEVPEWVNNDDPDDPINRPDTAQGDDAADAPLQDRVGAFKAKDTGFKPLPGQSVAKGKGVDLDARMKQKEDLARNPIAPSKVKRRSSKSSRGSRSGSKGSRHSKSSRSSRSSSKNEAGDAPPPRPGKSAPQELTTSEAPPPRPGKSAPSELTTS